MEDAFRQYKLNSKISKYCLCGAIARGVIGSCISRVYHFIGVSIPFHMPFIVSQYHDHNEKYIQFCTHLLGVERNFNMLVSKYGEVVQCGSGKSHWPFRSWMEATGCCGTRRCQSEYHIQTAAPIQGHDVKDRSRNRQSRNLHVHVSPQAEWIVQFAWRL